MYKDEMNEKNRIKYLKYINRYKVPEFIQEFLENNLRSNSGKIDYLIGIRQFLEWALENKMAKS